MMLMLMNMIMKKNDDNDVGRICRNNEEHQENVRRKDGIGRVPERSDHQKINNHTKRTED